MIDLSNPKTFINSDDEFMNFIQTSCGCLQNDYIGLVNLLKIYESFEYFEWCIIVYSKIKELQLILQNLQL